MKTVQISEELFIRLYGFFLLDKRDALNERIIIDQLQAKMDKIQARVEYQQGKKQPFKQGCMPCNQQKK